MTNAAREATRHIVVSFYITSEMLGELSDEEFKEVWAALGVVVRVRSRVLRRLNGCDNWREHQREEAS